MKNLDSREPNMVIESFYEKDGVIYEDEIFSNSLWEQPINHPTTFSTPANIAMENVAALHIKPEHIILEPSCGVGEYLYHLRHAKHIDAIELHPDIIRLIPNMANTKLYCMDFLKYKMPYQYDRIICSPPLKEKLINGDYLSHAILEHSWSMLKINGLMLFNYREDDPANSLNWLKRNGGIILTSIKRPSHKWFSLFQNAAIILKAN